MTTHRRTHRPIHSPPPLLAGLAVALVAALTATIGPAATAGRDWGTSLSYHSVSWTDDSGRHENRYTVDVPRRWRENHPGPEIGRFSDPTGSRTLYVAPVAPGQNVDRLTRHAVRRLEQSEANQGVNVGS